MACCVACWVSGLSVEAAACFCPEARSVPGWIVQLDGGCRRRLWRGGPWRRMARRGHMRGRAAVAFESVQSHHTPSNARSARVPHDSGGTRRQCRIAQPREHLGPAVCLASAPLGPTGVERRSLDCWCRRTSQRAPLDAPSAGGRGPLKCTFTLLARCSDSERWTLIRSPCRLQATSISALRISYRSRKR